MAQHPESVRRDQGLALTIQTATTWVAVVLIAIVGYQLPHLPVEYPFLLAALLPMIAAPAQSLLMSTFRGTERHQSYAWFNASGVVLTSIGGIVVLLLGGSAPLASATAGALFLANTVVAWKLSGLRPALPRFDRALWPHAREFVRAGLPFLSWQITQMAYSQIDRLMLGLLVPAYEVGWYAAANRIVSIPVFIPTLIITPLFPALSRSVNEPHVLRRTIAETLRFTLLLTVPLTAGMIVLAPVIPDLLGWPSDFSNAVVPMSILATQLPLVAVGMVLGSVLMAIGRERRLVLVALFATAFNVGANLVAIPALEHLTGNGGTGAALVTVASEIFMLVGALVLIPKQLLLITSVWDALRITVAGSCTAIAGVSLMPVGLVVSVTAAAATYVIVAALLRVLTMSDIHRTLRLLKHRRGTQARAEAA
jgi:O-antigen/teichoic acid export membrane protein